MVIPIISKQETNRAQTQVLQQLILLSLYMAYHHDLTHPSGLFFSRASDRPTFKK